MSIKDLLPFVPVKHHEDAFSVHDFRHMHAVGLLMDGASLDLPGINVLTENLPYRVIRQRGMEQTDKSSPECDDVLDMEMPVSQFISELAGWLDQLESLKQPVEVIESVAPAEHLPKAEPPLTERERQIMEQLSRGARYVDIADSLGLSIDTIRGHLKRIYRKLRVQSRTAAVTSYLGH